MDHRLIAEQMLLIPRLDENGRPTSHVDALAHAVLALIDRLDEIPILGLPIDEEDDDEEE